MGRPSIVVSRVWGPDAFRMCRKYVGRHHRHHAPPIGWKWGAVARRGGRIVGVAMVGRPLARRLDDGFTLEVLRLCTPSTSASFGAASRLLWGCEAWAWQDGATRLLTYTLAEESGASLRAADWVKTGSVAGRSWDCASRPRDRQLSVFLRPPAIGDKVRWEPRWSVGAKGR